MVVLIPPHKVKPYVRGQRNDMNDALAIAEAVGGLPLLFAFGQWRWCSQGRFSERRPAVDRLNSIWVVTNHTGLIRSTTEGSLSNDPSLDP